MQRAKRQATKSCLDLKLENNIVHVCVPPNLAHKFQPLDINVNGVVKGFLKDQFLTRYTDEIQKHNGKGVYEVDVDIRL